MMIVARHLLVASTLLGAVLCGKLGAEPPAPPDAARIGAQAVGKDGRVLGVVDNFLITADGQVHSVLIRTRIYLGLVECRMAVPKAQVRTATQLPAVQVDLTRDEFYKLPEWEPKRTPALKLARPE